MTPATNYRSNPALDDVFGIPPAIWREPQPVPASPLPSIPRPCASLTLPELCQTYRRTTLATPTPAPVVATVPEAAAVLERTGEDLLYWRGQWFHRCQQCGPREVVLIPVAGSNPRKEGRPLFQVPRSLPIQHQEGCPHAGEF